MILNGLLIWTLNDAIKQKQYGLASVVGFFGIGWYIGNIKGSANAADVYNKHIRNKFINKLFEKENLYEYIKN